jgi:phosphate transport system substrate-binding protein
MRRIVMSALILIFTHMVLLNSVVFSQDTEDKQHIVAAGSGVNLGITRLLANAFSKKNPHIIIDVPGSIGSRGAIKAVADNAIPLGLISRSLQGEEKALGLMAIPYARVAIVIGVHPSVAEDNITSEELIAIFAGKKTHWADGSNIIVQAREKSDSGFLVLKNNIPGFKEVYEKSHEAKRWTLYFTDQEANQALATVPKAIGVSDLGMISTEHLPIKVLNLNAISPQSKNIVSGIYPLSRQLAFIFKKGNLSEEMKAFFAFVFSEDGRKILLENGYTPVQ